uniref:TPR_REGION domain-containing protein n=1 Tax=Panagrellus redivivus TaxID=6233 RepID=A0A7E4UWM6_PANRE
MDGLPEEIKSFLRENNKGAAGDAADPPTAPTGAAVDDPSKDAPETPEAKAERQLDQRKAAEALLSKEVREARIKEAEAAKAIGNDHFGHGRWKEAEDAYTLAIDTGMVSEATAMAVYYSNRSAARIKLTLWKAAIEDADAAMKFGAPNTKPLERRAHARWHSGDNELLEGARDDYNTLLEGKPGHLPWMQAVIDINKQIDARNERLKDEMMEQLRGLGNIVLNPFGLSTDSFQFTEQPGGGYSVNMKQ